MAALAEAEGALREAAARLGARARRLDAALEDGAAGAAVLQEVEGAADEARGSEAEASRALGPRSWT